MFRKSHLNATAALVIILIFMGVVLLSGGIAPAKEEELKKVRVGYFPNITHSQALVGIARGDFTKALGENIKLETMIFNAGPSAIEALFAGEIDMTYIGPNPAINGYIRSQGKALKIVAGATSGGAVLVIRGDLNIKKPQDFKGKKIASPQLGNTQDVALRYYLKESGLKLKEEGGDTQVLPVKNPDQLTLFATKEIDAAWAVEPWGARLVKEAGGKIFLDERKLWPLGEFVTTHLIVRTEFLQKHPQVVKRWLRAHVELTQWIKTHPAEALPLMNNEIKRLTGKALPKDVLREAWSRMEVTYDPLQSSLFTSAQRAYKLGFLGKNNPDLKDIYDLTLLKEVLKEKSLRTVP
jgi:NitT/TauT family transport system substrate-binding protein